MKVVVTGGLGKLGKAVVQELIDDSDGRQAHEVTVFDAIKGPEQGPVRYLPGEIQDLGQVFGAIAGADAVIHLAAIRKHGIATNDVIWHTNVIGTFNVHEAAWRLGIRRVASVSSEAILGWDYREREIMPEYLPIDEDHPIRPQDSYGLSKETGEAIARSYTEKCGMETVVLRPPWIVDGPSMEQLRASGGLQFNRFSLCNYVDVRDLAVAFRLAVERPIQGNVVLFTMADDSTVAEPLCDLMPRWWPDIGDLSRDLTGSRPSVSNRRAAEVLGWRPQHSWRD
jgi:nucleoside-diphosphate-sugar epimerase